MRVYVFLISCVCVYVLSGCHTTYRTTAHHSRKPQFIDDIYMGSHNKNCSTSDCIDKSVKYPEKKYAEKKHSSSGKGRNTTATTNTNTTKTTTTKPNDELSSKEERILRDKYAQMMSVSGKDVTNFGLFRFIDDWYGVSYRMGGTEKTGIDCSGFVQKLYLQVFGIDLLRSSYEMFSNCEHLRKAEEASEGDLVFFKTRGRRISHVGVYLMNDYFVHASTTQGVMISSLKEEYWHKHFAGVGRKSRG